MKSISTESSITIEQDAERRQNQLLRKLFELWPLWVVVLSGIAACFKFYFRVNDIDAAQKRWQEGSEIRREKTRDEFESIHIKAAIQANEIEWLKRSLPCSND